MRIALLVPVLLLSACGHLVARAPPSFEKTADIAEAIRLQGAAVPAGRIYDRPEEFVGKRVLVEGFIVEACDNDAQESCAEYDQYFFIYSGESLPPAPGPPHQPCPLPKADANSRSQVLVSGAPPSGFRQPADRRALIQGTLARRPVTLTFNFRGSGTIFESGYDFVLDDVTVLALYDSFCEWSR